MVKRREHLKHSSQTDIRLVNFFVNMHAKMN
jgi:hypothetical protein